LRPVTFDYNANIGVPGNQFGFIAEEVEKIDPRLVVHDATGSPYSVRYENLTAVLAKGIQELDLNIESLASTTATSTPESQSFVDGFWKNIFTQITTWLADATNGIGNVFADVFHAKSEICVDDQCLNKDDVRALLALAHGANTNPTATTTDPTPIYIASSTPDTSSPVISIVGNNPAEVTVGSAYADLGATVTDTNGDGTVNNNLGLHFSVDGISVTDISLDTSTSSVHEIVYSAVDGAGNWGYATRTVNVLPQN